MTDLPPVQADRIELQQLLLNLIINANEAMSDGAKRDLLIASTEGETDNVRVLVCDSGRGLDPAAADRIFQAEWAWGLQSVDRLSRGWADSSRLARMSLAAPSLSSAYPSDKRAHRRSARGRSKLDNIGKRGVRYLRSLGIGSRPPMSSIASILRCPRYARSTPHTMTADIPDRQLSAVADITTVRRTKPLWPAPRPAVRFSMRSLP